MSGEGALHWQSKARWIRLNICGIQDEKVLRGSHSVDRCGTSRRSSDAAKSTAPGVRAA